MGTGNSEVFVAAMFVLTEYQGKGYGSAMLRKVEEYMQEKGLAGITLSTNKYAPAPFFCHKNRYVGCEHMLFMAKEM